MDIKHITSLNCTFKILTIDDRRIEEERLFELSKIEVPIMESIKELGFAIPRDYDYGLFFRKRKKMKVNKRFEGRTIFKESNSNSFKHNNHNKKHNIGKVF